MAPDPKAFEEAVNEFYQPLYRFALGLAGREADAADLTQRVFESYAEKAAMLRDRTKTKSWLFTTLYRDFLQQRRRATRFPESEIDEAVASTAFEQTKVDEQVDARLTVAALGQLDEPFRSALVLFYLREHSYREIADILDIPVGTVMSRISRGKQLLRERLQPTDLNHVSSTVKGATGE